VTVKPLVDPFCLCGRAHPCENHGGYNTPATDWRLIPMELAAQRAMVSQLVALVAGAVGARLADTEEVA